MKTYTEYIMVKSWNYEYKKECIQWLDDNMVLMRNEGHKVNRVSRLVLEVVNKHTGDKHIYKIHVIK